ncbi:hypothetical protein LTR27_009523 [Elasticomyces elasticus]|nr:hypothetical protein LTR27_009523 [Elasticomyces elasticus]
MLMDLSQDERTLQLVLCQLSYALFAAFAVERRIKPHEFLGQWICFEVVNASDEEARDLVKKWSMFVDPGSVQFNAALGRPPASVLAILILACFDDLRRVGSRRPTIKQEDETKQEGKVERQDEIKREEL